MNDVRDTAAQALGQARPARGASPAAPDDGPPSALPTPAGPDGPASPADPAASPATPASPADPAATAPARAAAYFDLDKTVLATSSALALGTPMRRSGLISTTTLARSVLAQLPYLLMGANEDHMLGLMEELAPLSRGLEPERLREVVQTALATVIEPTVYTEALDLIEAHHRAGHDVVVVSASMKEVVQPIASLIGADRALGTRMEVDGQGRFTGRVDHFLMHNAKAGALADDAAAHGIDLAASWAYSDSVSDLPMLQAVGHPMAVNPDRELRRRAAEEGWPVRDFKRPASLPTPSSRLAHLPGLPRPVGLRWELLASTALVLAVGGAMAVTVARRR